MPRALAAAVQALVEQAAARAGRRAAGSLGARCARSSRAAEQEAERLKDEFTSTEHLLLAIAAEGGPRAGRASC